MRQATWSHLHSKLGKDERFIHYAAAKASKNNPRLTRMVPHDQRNQSQHGPSEPKVRWNHHVLHFLTLPERQSIGRCDRGRDTTNTEMNSGQQKDPGRQMTLTLQNLRWFLRYNIVLLNFVLLAKLKSTRAKSLGRLEHKACCSAKDGKEKNKLHGRCSML